MPSPYETAPPLRQEEFLETGQSEEPAEPEAIETAMEADDGGKVDLREHVAVEDDDRLGELIAGVSDGAAGTEWHRFDDVAHAQAESFAFADDLLDAARLVVQAENDLVDLGHLSQQVDLVIEEGAVEDRDDRLRRMNG